MGIYLDHHATTPCDPAVFDAMREFWKSQFGNPSSPYWCCDPSERDAAAWRLAWRLANQEQLISQLSSLEEEVFGEIPGQVLILVTQADGLGDHPPVLWIEQGIRGPWVRSQDGTVSEYAGEDLFTLATDWVDDNTQDGTENFTIRVEGGKTL